MDKAEAVFLRGPSREAIPFSTFTIRNMNVADETTQWSVSARGSATRFAYDSAVTELAETALERAACEANPNTRWTDDRKCGDRSLI